MEEHNNIEQQDDYVVEEQFVVENVAEEATDYDRFFRIFFNKGEVLYMDCLNQVNAGRKMMFNVFAFLFGIYWMAYRKMYIEIIVLMFTLGIIDQILLLALGETLITFYGLVGIAQMVILSLTANYFYIQKAKRTMEKATSMYAEEDDIENYLRRKGGVNGWAPLILLILTLLVSVFFGEY